VNVEIRLEKDLLERVRVVAEKEGKTVEEWITEVVEDKIK